MNTAVSPHHYKCFAGRDPLLFSFSPGNRKEPWLEEEPCVLIDQIACLGFSAFFHEKTFSFGHIIIIIILRHYVVIALLSAVSSARMRPWLIFVIPCSSRSVFSKPSLRHSLSLLAWWQRWDTNPRPRRDW